MGCPIDFDYHWLTPKLQRIGAHPKENYRDQQTDCRNYAYAHGIDKPEIGAWR
jgi:xylulose-5-phosphate/fructose-6-phosphate phosphoketolase